MITVFNHKPASLAEVDTSVENMIKILGSINDLIYLFDPEVKKYSIYIKIIKKEALIALSEYDFSSTLERRKLTYLIRPNIDKINNRIRFIFNLFDFAGERMEGKEIRLKYSVDHNDRTIIFPYLPLIFNYKENEQYKMYKDLVEIFLLDINKKLEKDVPLCL